MALGLVCLNCNALEKYVEIDVDSDYLNIPVSQRSERARLVLTSEKMDTLPFEVRVADSIPDYWVFKDISSFKGSKLRIHDLSGRSNIEAIYQSDTINEAAGIYHEPNRPRYHFTSKRGWLNDPNGLVFNDGEYHLFYQHDPYDRDGLHKHWGHAVSTDLVHWTELPSALHPDTRGDIWSGTAVMDFGNTSGFGAKGIAPMVAAYTVDDGRTETQYIAFSNDNGRTFTKYEGNPVVASNDTWHTIHTRDPKLMRYNDSHWVMVLFERDGNTIYTSTNLRDWTPKSHITGFWECPELFELPVDGDPDNKMWVMFGASGTYMLGDFDGETFTPISGKHKYTGGSLYAAQTFNNIPESDGRRIQIGWGRINIPDAPFNQLMLMPTELSLVTTKDGIRLVNRPVREIDSLCRSLGQWTNLNQRQAEEVLNNLTDHKGLRIKAVVELSHATEAQLWLENQRIMDYDLNWTAFNGHFYSPQNPASMEIDVDIFIDNGVAEVFVDNGLFSDSMPMEFVPSKSRFSVRGNNITFKNLEVFDVDSIWE